MAERNDPTDLGLADSINNAALFDKKEHHDASTPADGPLFQDIDGDQQVTEIESLCMNCHENVRCSSSLLTLLKDVLTAQD
jgi:zinc finger protein